MAWPSRILTLNLGSSSLKIAIFEVGEAERLLLRESFGTINLETALERVHQLGWADRLDAVSHRIVHGGAGLIGPQLVTDQLLDTLEGLVALAPIHLPLEIAAIRRVLAWRPALPQVACFDTAFHRTMPEVAQLYPLPQELVKEGVLRYGFHGLSYESVVERLREMGAAGGRVIVAHLGQGASMAALRDGLSVETTMGFTPCGGLMMGTRSGDLDPGVVLYLLEQKRLSAPAVREAVSVNGGLLGVSGLSADMRDLLAREATSPGAARAVELFCYQARKHLGALAAVLGGVDTLVFTGGIGEHAAAIRARICERLEFLGVSLHEARNTAHAPIISRDGGRVTVRVIPTDEERMLARHAAAIVSGEQ